MFLLKATDVYSRNKHKHSDNALHTVGSMKNPLWSEKGTHSYKNDLIGSNHFTLITFHIQLMYKEVDKNVLSSVF